MSKCLKQLFVRKKDEIDLNNKEEKNVYMVKNVKKKLAKNNKEKTW